MVNLIKLAMIPVVGGACFCISLISAGSFPGWDHFSVSRKSVQQQKKLKQMSWEEEKFLIDPKWRNI